MLSEWIADVVVAIAGIIVVLVVALHVCLILIAVGYGARKIWSKPSIKPQATAARRYSTPIRKVLVCKSDTRRADTE